MYDQFVVAVGSAFDGIKIFGPFDDPDEATKWAEHIHDDWHVIKLLLAT